MGWLEHERVGNSQRAAVLELLSRALEEGYLDLDEYETRFIAVSQAKTVGELYTSVSDLPTTLRTDPRQSSLTSGASRRRDGADDMALVALILGAVSIPTSLMMAGLLVGAAAVVFARLGLRSQTSRHKAAIGMALGIVGMVLSAVLIILMIVAP